MVLAAVTNAWRTCQLIHTEFTKEKEWSYSSIKNKVRNSDVKLKKFMHSLAMLLIRSADNLGTTASVLHLEELQTTSGPNPNVEPMGFDGAPDTLQERLNAEQWSKRYKVKAFNRNNTFIE
jgi:hypothetical protein